MLRRGDGLAGVALVAPTLGHYTTWECAPGSPFSPPFTSEADPGDLVRPVPERALAQEVIGNRPDPPRQEVNFPHFLGASMAPGTGEGILALPKLWCLLCLSSTNLSALSLTGQWGLVDDTRPSVFLLFSL